MVENLVVIGEKLRDNLDLTKTTTSSPSISHRKMLLLSPGTGKGILIFLDSSFTFYQIGDWFSIVLILLNLSWFLHFR